MPMDTMVGVAQLAERRVVVADVAGSSPVTHPDEAVAQQRPFVMWGRFCPHIPRGRAPVVAAMPSRGRSGLRLPIELATEDHAQLVIVEFPIRKTGRNRRQVLLRRCLVLCGVLAVRHAVPTMRSPGSGDLWWPH